MISNKHSDIWLVYNFTSVHFSKTNYIIFFLLNPIEYMEPIMEPDSEAIQYFKKCKILF